MKKRFLLGTLYFIMPLVILAICAEMFARSIPNSYRYKKEWMDAHCDSVKTLILGNSHLMTFDASLFERGFNLSNSSQSPEYDRWLLEKYINKCPQLSTVIIPVDYHNLFAGEYEGKDIADWNRAVYYNLYMDCPKHGALSMYHYELSCSRLMLKKIGEYSLSKLLGEDYVINCDSLGRSIRPRNEGTTRLSKVSIVKELKKKKNSISNLEFRKEKNIEHLRLIANLCADHHVRLLMVSAPFWHTYNENLDSARLAIFYSEVERLKKENGLEYNDYRNDVRFTHKPHFFEDGQHLSSLGAALFSKIVKNDFDLQ